MSVGKNFKGFIDRDGQKHKIGDSDNDYVSKQEFYDHFHSVLKYEPQGQTGSKADIEVFDDGGIGTIQFGVKESDEEYKVTELTSYNIGNFTRALANPATTPENTNNKLITSKAVYDAFMSKMEVEATEFSIEVVNGEIEPIYTEATELFQYAANYTGSISSSFGRLHPIILHVTYDTNKQVNLVGFFNIGGEEVTHAAIIYLYVGNYLIKLGPRGSETYEDVIAWHTGDQAIEWGTPAGIKNLDTIFGSVQ